MVERVVQGQALVRRGRLTSSGSLALLFVLVAILALGLTLGGLMRVLPPDQWVAALMDGRAIGMPGLIFTYSALPRVTAALLCGAMLGLSGALFQQALRHPLAVPETLGVTAGAQLALAIVTLVAPAGLVLCRSLISFGGGGLAVALVLALS